MTLEQTLAGLRADDDLRAVLSALDAHAIVSVADRDGDIVYVNDKFCEVSGYAQDELLGRNHRLVRSDQHPPEFYAEMWRTISSGERWHGVICNHRKDGGYYWVDSTIAPVPGDDGKPARYLSIRTDISEIKDNELRARQTEQALRISEERLRRSQVFANIGTWDWDIQTGELYWSERIAPLFGYPEGPRETSCEKFLQAVHPDDRQRVTDAVGACVQHGAEFQIEHRCLWPDGTERWLLERGDVLRDADGKPLHMLGAVTDITDRKQAELALRQSEARLAEAQRIASLGNWQWDVEQDRLWWSDEVYRIFGHAPGAFEPSIAAVHAAMPAADAAAAMVVEQRILAGDAELDLVHRIVRPDGSERIVQELGMVEFSPDGKPRRINGTVQDVTERAELEQRLANKTRLLDALRHAFLRFVSDAPFEQLSESLLDSLIDVTSSEYGFIGMIQHEQDGTPYLKTYALTDIAWDDNTRQLYEESHGHGWEFRNLDTLFGVTIRNGELVISNDAPNDPRSGGLPHGHPPLHTYLGVPIYYGDRMVAMYGLANRPGGYDAGIIEQLELFNASYGVLVHACEVAQAEADSRAETERARQLAEKANQAKSDFLSAMSHELRTPLNAILGFAQLLELDGGKLDDDQRDNINEILGAGHHLLELINEVLDLAKIETGRIDLSNDAVDLDDLLAECCRLLAPMARDKGLQMDCDSALSATSVQGDYTRVKQVLLNLLSNAVKYNRPGGRVHVTRQLLDGERLRVTVEDTGIGIADDDLQQLFQPFHRVAQDNSEIEGTGIGLVISKRLVEAMGGSIGVDSEPGKGSRFWFELPRSIAEQPPAATAPQDAPASQLAQPTPDTLKRVLYVEDNPANMRLMEQILARYAQVELLSAPTPELALDLAPSFCPDLLLLDINLPRISGFELLGQLRALDEFAATPAIAISANAMARDIEKGLQHGFCAYLTKPLDIEELQRLLDMYLLKQEAPVI